MPLRPLRPNRSEKDLKRRSTLDPAGLFTRGDKSSRLNKSAEHLAPDRVAVSEDGGRPVSSDVPRPSWSANDENRPPTPPVQDHTPMTRRFSLMRFRHASDSQLSTKAKEHAAEDAPPVPAVPPAAGSRSPRNIVLIAISTDLCRCSSRHHHHSTYNGRAKRAGRAGAEEERKTAAIQPAQTLV